jgi:hypothetical protein
MQAMQQQMMMQAAQREATKPLVYIHCCHIPYPLLYVLVTTSVHNNSWKFVQVYYIN